METQITDLFGLQIYTDKGMFIGEVEDVVIDVDKRRLNQLSWEKSTKTSLR